MEIPNSDVDKNITEEGNLFPPGMVLILLLITAIFCSLLGNGLVYLISQFKGLDLTSVLAELSEKSPLSTRNFVRWANFISHIFTFTVPAIVVSIFLYRKKWLRFLKLDKSPILSNLLLGSLFIIAAFPIAQFTYWLNQQIPLPEWASQMESSADGMIKGILRMDTPIEFLFTLFIVAVLPAIGEELVFRGVVQQKIEERFKNSVLAIWLSAMIFSAIHFQFEGFFARMVLGAVLGYLFYWTRNLWVPIIAHFVTNGMQVVAQYLSDGSLTEMEIEQVETAQFGVTIIASIILVGLGISIKRANAVEDSSPT